MMMSIDYAFAQSGQKTLLFDGDLGLANIDIQLGLMPTYDLGSVIAQKSSATVNIGNTFYNLGIYGGTSTISGAPVTSVRRLPNGVS